MTNITDLVARAADSESQTDPERAASLTLAASLGAADLPEPPDGWCWVDGRVVLVEPSGVIPPLRIRPSSWWGVRSDEGSEGPVTVEVEPEPVTEPEPVAIAAPDEIVPAIYRPPSPWSRGGRVLALVRREGGATVDEIADATRLPEHSIRAMVSIARRAPGGPVIEFVKGERRYRLAAD